MGAELSPLLLPHLGGGESLQGFQTTFSKDTFRIHEFSINGMKQNGFKAIKYFGRKDSGYVYRVRTEPTHPKILRVNVFVLKFLKLHCKIALRSENGQQLELRLCPVGVISVSGYQATVSVILVTDVAGTP